MFSPLRMPTKSMLLRGAVIAALVSWTTWETPLSYAQGFDNNVVLPPHWAFGVLYGGYTDQSGTLQRVQQLIDGDYPIDGYWIDSNFWDLTGDGPKGYIDFVGDRQAFPNPAQMWSALEQRHVKAGIWVWHKILQDGNEPVYAEFVEKGYCSRIYQHTNTWHNKPGVSMACDVNFKDPQAAALWQAKLRPLFQKGLDFLKLDGSSLIPYLRTNFETTQQGSETAGRGFILSHAGSLRDSSFKRYPTKWTGDSQITWTNPGNTTGSGHGLKENIELVANPAKPTYAIPFLTHDAGGYFKVGNQALDDELYRRWIQFSVFNPIMEVFTSRGNPTANLPFNFSAAAQRDFRFYTQLRMQLFPYLYSYAHLTRQTGRKMIQGDGVHLHQYLFGRELLVAPVYVKGATSRSISLPAGTWIDYWTGQTYSGNRTITYPAPVDRIPVLVKAGTIIPMRQYARAIELGTNNPLTLDIYPAGTSSFTLFEDDGTSNAYLSGGYATTLFTTRKESTKITVDISPSDGSYIGQPSFRTYILKLNATAEPGTVLRGSTALTKYSTPSAFEAASRGWYYDRSRRITWVKVSPSIANSIRIGVQAQ